jgi:phospholipid-binding lipoprotein MlaA
MKRLWFQILLLAFLAVGCAHRSSPVSSPSSIQPRLIVVASNLEQMPLKFLSLMGKAAEESAGDPATSGDQTETEEGKMTTLSDPLEPFNRAMFQFNDKLYFWVLKPVAQGYNKVVPEVARVSVDHFFANLRFPIRFVSCLLQADFGCAGTELGRFTVNTVWGVGGLLDPASSKELNIPKRQADLGQTLGVYGLEPGFYIVWPILGPSSARDTAKIVGDYFLYPVSYINPWYQSLGVSTYEEVNDTSLRIGDYESLKEAAIDPYVALRDAYGQYRQGLIEAGRGKSAPPKPGGVGLGESGR